jgi:hypothetical protein
MTRPARRLNGRKGGLPAPPLGCANSPPGEYLGNSEAQACAEHAVARHAAFSHLSHFIVPQIRARDEWAQARGGQQAPRIPGRLETAG